MLARHCATKTGRDTTDGITKAKGVDTYLGKG